MPDEKNKAENHRQPTAGLLQSEMAVPACAAIVFAASLALYVATLAPTVTLVDSGELIVAARTLGVAHPPGFPLYVLLAHAATLLPIGNIAVRVNFASALFAALACATLTLLVAEILLTPSRCISDEAKADRKSRKKKKAKKSSKNASDDRGREATVAIEQVLIPALMAGLLLAFSRTLWAYATIAEVYALNTLLILIVFFLMFRWRRRSISVQCSVFSGRGAEIRGQGSRGAGEDAETRGRGDAAKEYRPPTPDPRPLTTVLYVAALVFGLALGVHHVTVGLILPALAAIVYSTEGLKFFKSRRLVYAALFAMAGLAVYVYLPIAASRSPVMNWGDPETLERFWWHVTGRQYQVFFSISLSRMVAQVEEFVRLASREFGPWWFPAGLSLAAFGFIALFRRQRATFWVLALIIAADLAYALNYEIAEDKDAYYLPTFLVLALAAGVGAHWLICAVAPSRFPLNLLRGWGAAVLLLLPVVALAANLPFNNRSRYFIASDYVDNILKTVEPRGLLLTLDWQVYSPMLYVLEIEGRRRDVVAVDVNQLRRSWYFDYLEQAYPELIEKSRGKVDAFLEDLRSWEQNPEIYAADLTLNQRINSRFYDMIVSFVTSHIESAPVYVTQDIATNLSGQDRELTQALSESYQLVPQGLVFQLLRDREFHDPVEPQLQLRGLADGTLRFEKDDVVRLKVKPVYLNMLVNRGRYLAAHNRHEQAIESFRRALALDPEFAFAKQLISLSESALRNAETGKP